MTKEVLLGYVLVWALPRCHELAGNKSAEFDHDIYCNDQSYMKPSKKTNVPWQTEVHWDQELHSLGWILEKRSGSPIYLHRWADSRYFGKTFVQDEKFASRSSWRRIPYWKRKRLLLGWEGALMCYWFMDIHFSVRKMVQDEQFLSSSKSGLRFPMDKHFPV